ncbi:MAG: RodZ domain-containing protein [Polaromonas sp.]
MSEDNAVQQLADTGVIEPAVPLIQRGAGHQDTAGSMLREARQAQGLDIETLAGLLKVPAQKLQALEQDQFDQLLDAVFARALASSLCRILKLDPAQVLQRLPAIAAFKVTSQNRGINTPFRAKNGGQGGSMWSHMSRPAVLVGLALLLGALILIFLPVIQQEITRFKSQGQGVSAQSQSVEAVYTASPVTAQGAANSGASEVVSSPVAFLLPPTEAQPFVSVPATAPSDVNSADTNANATITFSAKSESWIKVTDAKGGVVMSQILRAGDSAGASGALPLVAVVGRADAIQVLVRGQAFDLGGVTKNNVARFEVK